MQGFLPLTSRAADVVMNAPPVMTSAASPQYGEVGKDAQINCDAVAVPEPTGVEWWYQGTRLDEGS